MERIIKSILKQRREILKRAGITKDCEWFAQQRVEGLGNLAEVFFHPQGVEFCQKYNYPSLDILRKFKTMAVERYGVYIDAGEVDLLNHKRVILIGNTRAKIQCSRDGSTIILMHEAKADIIASDWAVVGVHYNNGCEVNCTRQDRAIINEIKTSLSK